MKQNKNIEAFLKSDRQWRREERIPHARYQLLRATTAEERSFWEAVLRANTQEPQNG